MANFFDQFDEAPKTGNFFDQFDEKPAAKKSTIGSELVRGGKQLVSSIRTGAGALTGSPEEAALAGVARSQAIGEEAGEGASLEAVKKAYQDRGLLSAAGEVASQVPRALAGQVPQLVAMAGTAKLGAMAGAPLGPAGVIGGGILGAGASLLPQFFGSNIERQAAEQMAKDQPVQIDRGSAGAAAAGQAALEGAGTAFVLGKRIVKGVLGIADDAALATTKAQQAMTQTAQRSLAASAGRGIAKGAVVEMPVEIAQSVLERAQAGLDVTSPEALAEYGEVAYQAGLVGGAIGAGAGPIDTAMARQGVKARTAFEEAEATRKAEAEAARLAAEEEAKAKIPPLALGAEGAFTPVVLPDGSVAMTREELAQYEAEQFRKKYEPQKVEQPPVPEPYVKPPSISGTKPDVLLGEREDPLAGLVSGRRAAAEPVGEVPLSDDYAFLQREKQRLLQEEQTPQTKQLLGRINDQLGEVLNRDIERLRKEAETLRRNREADEEAAKTSVFGQAELPPVESRDVVMGNMELGELQAREAPPVDPLTGRELKGFGKMEGTPQPMIPEVEAKVEKLTQDQEAAVAERENLEKRTSGTSLIKVLQGSLNDGEMSELGGRARKIGKNPFISLVAKKGTRGSSMEDMVNSGKLDLFLPFNMRPDQLDYDVGSAAEYIREKLRNNQFYTYETELEIRKVNEDIESIERQIQDLLSDDDINKELQYAADEQRELDQAAQEFAPEVADRAPEQRQTKTTDDDLDKRQAQLDREEELNQREARLLEERRRLEEERLKLEKPTKEDVKQQEERKEKAPEIGEREQVRKESEAGAGQFELTREEGRQDTTGDIFNQPEPAPAPKPAPEPEATQVSIDEERKTALAQFKKSLLTLIPPFRSRGGDNRVTVIKPTALNASLMMEVYKLASDALDLGLPPAALGNINAAGSTRSQAIAMVTNNGWLMVGSQWKRTSPAEKLLAVIHEIGHVVDAEGGMISDGAKWDAAHTELKEWYRSKADKIRHPFAYPFASQYKGQVRIKSESFAQAFGYYFTSPVDLQTNAPEAYSQIQSIVERIQNESQRARAAGATKTGTAGIKVQPSRTTEGAAVQPEAGTERTDVSPATRLTDRSAGEITKPSPVTFYEDIPNESWLQGKVDYAIRSPRNEFGVPKMSSVTGSFKKPVMIPTRWLTDAKGQRGEEKNVRQKDLDAIRKIIRETGKFPLNEDGTEYVPYIEIGYDGKPWVSEGNHRIMAAIAEGLEYIPVELRYFDGGQRRAGKWNPENVKEITERLSAISPEDQDINAMQAAPDTPAFKRWFGDSKVVDENGDPLVVYHGSINKGVTEFDTTRITTRTAKGDVAGTYFTTDQRAASGYTRPPGATIRTPRGDIVPAYLKIENPLNTTAAIKKYRKQGMPFGDAKRKALEALTPENDGIIFDGDGVNPSEYVVFKPTQIKSAISNIGTFDPEVQDINMMQANPTRQNIFGEPVLGTWSITTDPKMELQDGLIYKLLDKNIDVKRIVEAVKSTGKEIATKWNPYLQEELYHGRTANASQEFKDNEWLPLLLDMEKKGVTIGELEKYLLNRHAEAYNKLMAERNPNRPEMQDGGSSVTTADARKYLANLDAETKAKYDELAARIDSITKGTRQLLVDTGYEKAETIKAWEKAFPTYVPLMREEGDFDYNFGSFGTGRGFDVRRDFSRSAMGSKRNVVDIIGNVISARNNAIALTEKNRVAQAVYGLALEAPNPDFWMAINPDAEKVPEDAIDELRSMGLDPEAIEFLMKEPKQRILDPKRKEVVSRINTKLRENDYVLATRINGERRYVFFNPKDPRANRAATALKNLDAQDLGTALGIVAKVTRWMASVNTQYNPIFGPYNFLRDVQSAALQLSTTELAGQQKEIAANVVPSLRAVYSSLRKRRKGEKAEGQMADLWKEFQKEGGQTGFKDNFSRTQDRTEALLDEMSKLTEGKAKAGARAVFDWLSDYNDSLENAVRLSAYKVAKEKFKKEGSSDAEAKQRAASLAKNLTVNFNRKGDVATQMGALYAFFNASMQGTARMIETLKGPMGKKIMAGGLLLGGMQAALLAAAGFDEDEPPEFIRSKNIVIPTGDGDYFAFPMPLGFHVIPGISRILTEWTLSGFNDTAKRVTDLTGLFLDAFNPIGNAGWSVQTITPTVLDPLVALGENKDWTGKPISKEDLFSLRPTPGYTRARDGANWFSTKLAEYLNLASGGTKHQPGVLSPTPEQIEYLVGQVFGGVGREAVKLSTSIEKTATGEDLPPYKIPLYGRFFGETKSTAAESNRFYKNMERLNRLDLEIKGRREDKEPIGDFMRENPEARLLPLANKTYKDVQELRKRRTALLERDAPKESIQAVENMITRKMQVLNDRVKAMQQ